ncbi:MAG TPA: N-acetyltransferase [Actinoplanes sp.]|nr:N-acetyltransferase [Actinoplanes sp.]
MLLRAEQDRDHDAVRAVHRSAFGDGHGTTVAGLVDALREADPAALSLVAEEDGDLVGHVMISRALLDAPRRLVPVGTLSPLAVVPAHQRRGIGAALIRQALREFDDRGVPLVFVEGDPAYYSRRGFRAAIAAGFRKPSLRIPDAAFQVTRLSGWEPWMTGTLIYPDTFWEQDCVGLRDPSA